MAGYVHVLIHAQDYNEDFTAVFVSPFMTEVEAYVAQTYGDTYGVFYSDGADKWRADRRDRDAGMVVGHLVIHECKMGGA